DEWQKAVSEMFGGSRSAGTIFQALNQRSHIEEVEKRLLGVHGESTLNRHYGQFKESDAGQLELAKSQAEAFANSVGKMFTGPVLGGAKDFLSIMGWLVGDFEKAPGPLKDLVGGLIGF